MTDVFDRAQEREAEMRQDALAEQRRNHPAQDGESALICCECDGEIPEGRRQAVPGVQTCVECQTFLEKAGRFDWGIGE